MQACEGDKIHAFGFGDFSFGWHSIKLRYNSRVLRDSAADETQQDIIAAFLTLANYPDKHKVDQYKTQNDGSWRAFEIHHCRISYRVRGNEVRIIRLRHTSRSPLKY
ncbi:type II toxin-antitoxin system RelE/ParE family toxin [Niabella hibiscisoli]|uniref:type II toxin-antitoxin system RelE/ParE family toxin n=1 Tax=Niabella hibiscisoli TaxID=1825928 RepID=UPI00374DC344